MSDERFFSQVKSTLQGYAPEVPESVYNGMRRKLWMSRFTKLSATRFNMWYLLLILASTSGAVAYYFQSESVASKMAPVNAFEWSVTPMASNGDGQQETVASADAIPMSCCSQSHASCAQKSCSADQKSGSTANFLTKSAHPDGNLVSTTRHGVELLPTVMDQQIPVEELKTAPEEVIPAADQKVQPTIETVKSKYGKPLVVTVLQDSSSKR